MFIKRIVLCVLFISFYGKISYAMEQNETFNDEQNPKNINLNVEKNVDEETEINGNILQSRKLKIIEIEETSLGNLNSLVSPKVLTTKKRTFLRHKSVGNVGSCEDLMFGKSNLKLDKTPIVIFDDQCGYLEENSLCSMEQEKTYRILCIDGGGIRGIIGGILISLTI